jgi:hypothetical protein
MANEKDGGMTDAQIEIQIRGEKEYYQSTYDEAVDVVCQVFKLPKDRVVKIANTIYTEEERAIKRKEAEE